MAEKCKKFKRTISLTRKMLFEKWEIVLESFGKFFLQLKRFLLLDLEILHFAAELHDSSRAKQIDVHSAFQVSVEIQGRCWVKHDLNTVHEGRFVLRRQAQVVLADVSGNGYNFIEKAIVPLFLEFIENLIE